MSRETKVDAKWLHEHGGLHDARITGLQEANGEVSISIKDEWIDHEGFPDYKGPSSGKIIARGFERQADGIKLTSDWIMDVVFDQEPLRLRIDLNDGSEFVLEASSFWWRPD